MSVDADQSPVSLPLALYTGDQVRELDRISSEAAGLSPAVLMSRAGRAAFKAISRRWPDATSLTVLCGGGNNAGDGYLVAALAAQKGFAARALWLKSPEQLSGAARQAYDYAVQEGVVIAPFDQAAVDDLECTAELFVDALLGTGVSGAVRAPYDAAIAWLNSRSAPVIALDVPSGLGATTGAELGVAVRADLTITFIGCKQGLLTARGPSLAGELIVDDLGVPDTVFAAVKANAERCQFGALLRELPARLPDSHKGDFGHVLIIGGDRGLGGAAIIAAEAVARSGAGLVSLATQPEHIAPALTRLPEAMVVAVTSGQELEPHLVRPDVVALGPGLGRSSWAEQMLQQAAKANLPMVVDADALNLLAEGRVLRNPYRDNWILTPHPGEAARLLGETTAAIQADRFAAVTALQKKYGGVVVLKGAGTLIADGAGIALADVGNPGMAVGGMGDLLTGVIAALLAQGLKPSVAARLGVCIHGMAGDLAAEDRGQRGLLPTDLLPYIRELLNP